MSVRIHRQHWQALLGELCGTAVAELPLRRSWCLVHSRHRRLSPVAQAFLRFVREQRPLSQQTLARRFGDPE